jgi:hypothetical protein
MVFIFSTVNFTHASKAIELLTFATPYLWGVEVPFGIKAIGNEDCIIFMMSILNYEHIPGGVSEI